MTQSIYVRTTRSSDYTSLATVESASFLYAWDVPKIKQILRLKNHIGFTAELNGIPVGYIVYNIFRSHMELVRIAVHPEFHGQGIGLALMDKLKASLSAKKDRIIATVSEWNTEGHQWLKRQGFLAEGVQHMEVCDYYEFAYHLDAARSTVSLAGDASRQE